MPRGLTVDSQSSTEWTAAFFVLCDIRHTLALPGPAIKAISAERGRRTCCEDGATALRRNHGVRIRQPSFTINRQCGQICPMNLQDG
jgi:hypothetical protein